MSLNFQYFGKENTDTWTEEDWSTYNALVWFTLAVDIGYLCEESAEEFVRRVNIQKLCKETLTVEMIEKFNGLCTNVTTLTARDWAVKHFAGKYKTTATAKWKTTVMKACDNADKLVAQREVTS